MITYDPFAEFIEHVLPNGLKVYLKNIRQPWVAVNITVHSGAREDPIEARGTAHFLEHALNQNIPGFSNHLDFRHHFYDLGGEVTLGRTGYLSTNFGFFIPSEKTELIKVLGWFGGMLLESPLTEGIEKERGVILREFREEYPNDKSFEFMTQVNKALYSGHRLENYTDPLGTLQSITAMTQQDLFEFYKKHYIPANMSITVTGGVSIEEFIKCLNVTAFAKEGIEGVRNPVQAPLLTLPKVTINEFIVRESDFSNLPREVTQLTWYFSFPMNVPPKAQTIFRRMLDRILITEFRDKRSVVYDTHVGYMVYQEVKTLLISISTSPSFAEEAKQLLRKCISMLRNRKDLFDQYVKRAINGLCLLDYSGRGLCDCAETDLAYYQKITTIDESYSNYQKLKFEDITNLISYLNEDRQFLFVHCP